MVNGSEYLIPARPLCLFPQHNSVHPFTQIGLRQPSTRVLVMPGCTQRPGADPIIVGLSEGVRDQGHGAQIIDQWQGLMTEFQGRGASCLRFLSW
jgi:hypothetical protein